MATTQEPELTDEQILEFEQRIKDEEASKIPLVCQAEPISILNDEFKGNEPFLRKIKNLSETSDRIRKCRGDGNCFFRAFAFAWFESLMMAPEQEYQAALAKVKSTPDMLERAGFQKLAFEDFYDVFLEQLEQLPARASDPDMLLVSFQSEEISNCIVMYLRFIASAYLRINSAEYEPFLMMEQISIDEFCAMHVEAFGRESDHLQIIALTKALGMPVEIVYLDGGQNEKAVVHEFLPNDGEETRKPLRLIYRPGHYDIVYNRN